MFWFMWTVYCNIILPCMVRPEWFLLQACSPKFCTHHPSMYIICPAHIFLDLIIPIILGEKCKL